jgi:hypothetical protein
LLLFYFTFLFSKHLKKGAFSAYSFKDPKDKLFAFPIIGRFSRTKTTSTQLYSFILKALSCFFKKERFVEGFDKIQNFQSFFSVSLVLESKEKKEIYELNEEDEEGGDVNNGKRGGLYLRDGNLIVCWEYLFYKKNYLSSSERNFPQIKKNNNKSEIKDLEDCFELFNRPEILSESDAWFCPKCKKHQQASKEFSLWKLPKYLVLQLKRFSTSGMYRNKLSKLIDFPLKGLDLSRFVDGPKENTSFIYNLFAVSNHSGGLGGGHYVAHALVGDDWYEFDDGYVTKSSSSNIVDKSAYLLFYERVDSSSPSIPLNSSLHQSDKDQSMDTQQENPNSDIVDQSNEDSTEEDD